MEYQNKAGGLYKLINPLTPYFIADFYISDEISYLECNDYSWRNTFDRSLIKGVDLLKTRNYDLVKDYNIVQCEMNLLSFFKHDILPELKGKKIVLFTSQCKYPSLELNELTGEILNHPSILLWISQNPIYENHHKFMAFPYGIHQDKVHFYYKFMKNTRIKKKANIPQLKLSYSSNLPNYHIRMINPLLSDDNWDSVYYYDYLKILSESKFVLSPEGEMSDIHLNCEAIGLGAIPVSNIDFSEIYEDKILCMDEEEINNIAFTGKIDKKYVRPSNELITLEYWLRKIYKIIDALKSD